MLGVELLPRIRNWKDLIFYRPNANSRYDHIDTLFGKNEVIDWKLIETHWSDLMRVVVSIRQGRIASSALPITSWRSVTSRETPPRNG